MSDEMLPGYSLDEPEYSPDYLFSSLTYEIRDKNSPLRQYFNSLVKDLGGVQRDYRSAAGPMLVGWSGVNAGTLGAAFDFTIRFSLDSHYGAEIARGAFGNYPEALDGVDAVIRRSQRAASTHSRDDLHSACWALALFTEVYRVGLTEGSPLREYLVEEDVDVDGLLAATPPAAMRELDELGRLAEARLLPVLAGPFHLGPTFAGSAYCKADADVIASGCLLDLKTRVGAPNRSSGLRHDDLRNVDVFQMLGYALFDFDDQYGITRLGMYSSRYGHMTTWDLEEFMERIACRPVDVEAERQKVKFLLTGQRANLRIDRKDA